jgi:glyoxylase-like metal-dependent hydrolase (beta-lactamase superfamily II)
MKLEQKKLGNDDVKFIINTHWHHDHTGGNLLFGRDATIIAHNSVREDLAIRKQISLFDVHL